MLTRKANPTNIHFLATFSLFAFYLDTDVSSEKCATVYVYVANSSVRLATLRYWQNGTVDVVIDTQATDENAAYYAAFFASLSSINRLMREG